MKLPDYTPYITIMINIFAIFAGYFLGVRRYKTEYFYNNLKDSLGLALSPMFHEMKKIKKTENPENREVMLEKFFHKYCGAETIVYKIGDMFILKWFYDMEELYKDYCKKKDDFSWREFWIKFYKFYIMIEDNYFDAFSTLYIDHRWMLKLQSSGFTYKFLNEFARFAYEYFKFLIALGGITIVILLSNELSGTKLFSSDFIKLFAIVYILVLCVFGVTIMLANNYLSLRSMQKPKNNFRRYIEKRFSKFFKWWDEFLNIKSKDNDIDIPQR